MSTATLTLTSKNYGAWSLRGWLLCRMAGLDFTERAADATDPAVRAELLLQSPSLMLPRLEHDGVVLWDTMAIAEYLHELRPEAKLLPDSAADRARCRSISGEMHSGFAKMRAALPMNIKARHRHFKLWAGAQDDVDRIITIWTECLAESAGPFLFGASPTVADAMFAPVCTRFVSYDVEVPPPCAKYVKTILTMKHMVEWIAAAEAEPDVLAELDEAEVEF